MSELINNIQLLFFFILGKVEGPRIMGPGIGLFKCHQQVGKTHSVEALLEKSTPVGHLSEGS